MLEVGALYLLTWDDAGEARLLRLSNGERVRARSIVIASGARYRRLAVANLEAFEGVSVHYWASRLVANTCAGHEVALVGAGNSAGQAAVYLASKASTVWLLAHGEDIAASMSRYLVNRALVPALASHPSNRASGPLVATRIAKPVVRLN